MEVVQLYGRVFKIRGRVPHLIRVVANPIGLVLKILIPAVDPGIFNFLDFKFGLSVNLFGKRRGLVLL